MNPVNPAQSEDAKRQQALQEATEEEIKRYLDALDSSSIAVFEEYRLTLSCNVRLEKIIKGITTLVIGIVGIAISCDAKVCLILLAASVVLVGINLVVTHSRFKPRNIPLPSLAGVADQVIESRETRKVYKWDVQGQVYGVYAEPDSSCTTLVKYKGQFLTEVQMAEEFKKFQEGLASRGKLAGPVFTYTPKDWSAEKKKLDAMHNAAHTSMQAANIEKAARQEKMWEGLKAKYIKDKLDDAKRSINFYNFRHRVLFISTCLMFLSTAGGCAYVAICPGFPVCSLSSLPTLVFEIYLQWRTYLLLNAKISFHAQDATVFTKKTVVQGFAGKELTEEEKRRLAAEEQRIKEENAMKKV